MVEITREQFNDMRRREAGFPVVNVLPEAQFEEAHIPGSINVPLGEGFVERVREHVIDPSAPLVVYCAGPDCDASSKAARQLDEAGFTQVYDYSGGLEEWEESGEPIDGSRNEREQAAALEE